MRGMNGGTFSQTILAREEKPPLLTVHLPVRDTVAQRAETTVPERAVTSCV